MTGPLSATTFSADGVLREKFARSEQKRTGLTESGQQQDGLDRECWLVDRRSCQVAESIIDFPGVLVAHQVENGISFESGTDHIRAASGVCLGKTTREQSPERKDWATTVTGPLSVTTFSADGDLREEFARGGQDQSHTSKDFGSRVELGDRAFAGMLKWMEIALRYRAQVTDEEKQRMTAALWQLQIAMMRISYTVGMNPGQADIERQE
jgi:hypothetical protein